MTVTCRCCVACWELMLAPFVVSTKTCPLPLLSAGLFLQQCHFLRQAGHSEKVVSLFQAMVDFTFFKPDSVKELPTKVQVWLTLSLRGAPAPGGIPPGWQWGVLGRQRGGPSSHIHSPLTG